MLIHDRNELPSLTFTDYFGETPLEYSMTRVKRLPLPYDSNCFDHKSSKSFKSRGHCINDCLVNKIFKKYNCIPRESRHVLTFYDNMTLNSTFCDRIDFKNFSEKV
jgi:hypothetical protein